MNIWQYQQRVTNRLLKWAGISVVLGLLMRTRSAFWQGIGGQFIAWGVINAMIGLIGEVTTRDRLAKMDNPGRLDIRQQESSKLERLLWINTGLDVIYMLFGVGLSRSQQGKPQRVGTGWGIVMQGAFLFFFDLIHASNMPEETRPGSASYPQHLNQIDD